MFTFSVFCGSSDSSCLTKRPAGCCPIQRFVAWIWEMKKMPGSWIHGRLLGQFFIFSPNFSHFYHLSILCIFLSILCGPYLLYRFFSYVSVQFSFRAAFGWYVLWDDDKLPAIDSSHYSHEPLGTYLELSYLDSHEFFRRNHPYGDGSNHERLRLP